MREIISRFKPFSVRSHGLLVRVVSLSVILCLLCSGKSLHVLWILLFGTWSLSACRIMLVRVLFAVCRFVGSVVSEKAVSVSSVYCFQFDLVCMSVSVLSVHSRHR